MIRFCCCDKTVCISIGELTIQPMTKEKANTIRWWMIDMARDILNEIVQNLDRCDLSEFEQVDVKLIQDNLKKMLRDLEVLSDAFAQNP